MGAVPDAPGLLMSCFLKLRSILDTNLITTSVRLGPKCIATPHMFRVPIHYRVRVCPVFYQNCALNLVNIDEQILDIFIVELSLERQGSSKHEEFVKSFERIY